jgi:hypothetical protein
MRTHTTHAFANQLVICLIVSFAFGGTVGLGAVWMRHQITVTARNNRALQASIAEVRRRLDATAAIVETEQGYDALTQRNAEWHLGLAPKTDAQVISVSEDPVQRLARRRGAPLFADGAAPITFRLAQKD